MEKPLTVKEQMKKLPQGVRIQAALLAASKASLAKVANNIQNEQKPIDKDKPKD